MDLAAITAGLVLLKTAVSTAKEIIDALPDGPKKQEAVTAFENAERQIKSAEAQTAQGLGYELCRNHYPPEIMLSEDGISWRCLTCPYTTDTGPAMAIVRSR